VIVYGAFVLASRKATEAVWALAKATGAKLMAVGPMANSYGLESTGVLPGQAGAGYGAMLEGGTRALILSGLDPAQDAVVKERLKGLELLVVHDAFPSATTAIAQVVLPAKTGYEKDGTTVNLEGRFLPVAAAPLDGGVAEDLMGVVKVLGEALGRRMEGRSLRSSHRKLKASLGIDLAGLPPEGAFFDFEAKRPPQETGEGETGGNLLLVPSMARPERLGRNPHLRAALGDPALRMHPRDAEGYGLGSGDGVRLRVAGVERLAVVRVSDAAPRGLLLLPALPEQRVGLYSLDVARDVTLVPTAPPPPLPNEDLPDSRLTSGASGASD
nr:molybdopterin-dependent oxidoreductase [Deinococcota bacterium]